jgi:hypothetical protein
MVIENIASYKVEIQKKMQYIVKSEARSDRKYNGL